VSKLRKNLTIYAGADILGRCIGLVTSPLVTRLLTEDQFGAVGLLVGVWTLVSMAQYAGMDAAFPMFRAQVSDEGDRRRILVTSTIVATISFAVVWGLFAVVGLAGPWLGGYARVDKLIVLVFLLSLIPTSLNQWYLYLLRYMHRAPAFARISLAGRVAGALLALPLMWLVATEHRLTVFYAVACLAQMLALSMALREFRRIGRWPYATGGLDRPLARKMLGYGMVLVPGFAVYAMCSVVDRLLVGWLARDQAHIITLAIQLGAAITMLRGWFGMVWDPHMVEWLSTRDPKVYLPKLNLALVVVSLVFFSLAALTALWSDWVVGLLYPASYMPTAALVPVLALAGALSVLSLIGVATAMVANSPRYHLPIYACAMVINGTVGIWTIPKLGALGAVLGTLAAEAFIILAWITLGSCILRNLRLKWFIPAAFVIPAAALICLYSPGAILYHNVFLERLLLTVAVAAVALVLARAFRPADGWRKALQL